MGDLCSFERKGMAEGDRFDARSRSRVATCQGRRTASVLNRCRFSSRTRPMTDRPIRMFMLTRPPSTPSGDRTMSPGAMSADLFAPIVATQGIAAAAAGERSSPPSGVASSAACAGLRGHAALRGALVNARGVDNGGFDLDMWGAVVNRDGIVCAIAYAGTDR